MLVAAGVSHVPVAGSYRSRRGSGVEPMQQCPNQSRPDRSERSANVEADCIWPPVSPDQRALQERPSKWSTAPRSPEGPPEFPGVNQTPRVSTAACTEGAAKASTSGPSERLTLHAPEAAS